jgi:aryl-alcohol dehydrogenase-like predicted oxidoreductase
VRYKPLGRTGLNVSVIGFGASPLGNEFGLVDPGEGERAVHAAIEHGINFFDVAPYYGRTLAEERLGAALHGKRDKVVLATKIGRYGTEVFDFSAKRVRSSVDESLRRLRTDYVDILTAHDIEFGERNQIIEETIPAMRALEREGKTRSVGISGLQLKVLGEVAVRAQVDTVLSYCRYNLMIRDLDIWLTPALQPREIGLINASPLHMRLLTDTGAPAWHPAPEAAKQAGAELVRLCGADTATLALRFCLDHPYVSSILVGMSNATEVSSNLRALQQRLPSSLLAEIERIVEPVKNMAWRTGRPENYDFPN